MPKITTPGGDHTLWLIPDPPLLRTKPQDPLPQPPGAQPHSGPQRQYLPTGRNPTTGAPIHVPGEPELPFSELPPSGWEGQRPPANARSPITGAELVFLPVPTDYAIRT